MVWSTEVNSTPPSRLGFVGLGDIGGGAAANLARAGYHITATDLDDAKVQTIVDLGGHAADSILDVAKHADVVFTSLPGPRQIESVGLGIDSDGILSVMAPGATWIELSTNNLATAERLRLASQDAGVHFIDAPVSGGPEGAADASLSIFVGGSTDTANAVRPLLEVMVRRSTMSPLSERG
jgi:3-hydroxyisobutyrate dehydrogenase